MTWDVFHHRGEVLRAVVETADACGDGVLPMELPGVAETFGDELALIGALQLRWHTRLAGRIERELMAAAVDLETAVITAWRATAAEMPGVRAILDAHSEAPTSEEMAKALAKAHRKDWALMAAMAGKASAQDAEAAEVGRVIEHRARTSHGPVVAATPLSHGRRRSGAVRTSLLGRIKSRLAA